MAQIKRALISVSDKNGIVEFCQELVVLGIELLSTGGTAKSLTAAGLQPVDIADYTGFPEMMGGRVKTLHPRVHGALLARLAEDGSVMEEHGILAIDLLVVNLYPFEQTIRQADCTLSEATENIDIGGPAMLRSAAKNYTRVAAVTDNNDYAPLLREMRTTNGELSLATRFRLAGKAFAHTAAYDGNIANYFGMQDESGTTTDTFPATFTAQFHRQQVLRYGENPHQQAALYIQPGAGRGSLAAAELLQGKALSYNNLADANVAWQCVLQFSQPGCVIVKHANPCGVASADTLNTAYQHAYATDPTSAFGGIIALNRTLDVTTAQSILQQQFTEVIIAPDIEAKALSVCAQKPNLRLLSAGTPCSPGRPCAADRQLNMQRISGGLLLQDEDDHHIDVAQLHCVTRKKADEQQIEELLFAWRVVKYVKSNAIVYCAGQRTLGIGAGQMSRIYSARIAAIKAKENDLPLDQAVMASDAFFPFRDSIDQAAEVGIHAIIQPGGSVRDEEVIQAANEHGMIMLFTGVRHFLH